MSPGVGRCSCWNTWTAALGSEQQATYQGLLVRLNFPLQLPSGPHKEMTVKDGETGREGEDAL